MKIAIMTDEISSDLETSLEIGMDWGVPYYELRGIGSERVGSLSTYTTHHMYQTIERFGASVIALSPGIFKVPLIDPKVPDGFQVLRWQDQEEFYYRKNTLQKLEDHLNILLPESLGIANKLGVKTIVIFGVNRPEGVSSNECPEYVVDLLREAAKKAEKAGVTLALENEHICFADTAQNTVRLIEKIDHPNLRINWDPANAYYAGEDPYPFGYEFVKDYVAHVHFKDAITTPDGKKRYVVEGGIQWDEQLRHLQRNGYDGFVTIETHCRPKVKSAKQTLERIQRVLDNQ
jgi:sugar phosphate isomerase/epimerase